MTWIADRELVVARDGSRVLGPQEPQNGYLLAGAGCEVSDVDCRRYGLGPHAAKGADSEAKDDAPEPRGVGLKITGKKG